MSEAMPTLTSLLLSTAQSLASTSTADSAATSAPSSSISSSSRQPFPDLPSSPEQFLSSTDSTAYLSSLLCLPLTKLQALPASLAVLSSSLDNDLSSLAFTRYSSFLLSHSASSTISSSFTSLSSSLDQLLDSTTALESAAKAFEGRIHSVREKRERMVSVRERMDEVEELLEVPAIVDACVRAGHWSEAIDVALRLSDLYSRLLAAPAPLLAADMESADKTERGGLILLRRVRKDVALALLSLRARVLESLLHRGLKLPGAVRGIAILRRINASGSELDSSAYELASAVTASKNELAEETLRIVFLAARWRCLRGELDSVEGQMVASGIKRSRTKSAGSSSDEVSVTAEDNEERTRWIKRWIEIWREIIGETIGMYTEVFLSSRTVVDHLEAASPITLFLSTAVNSLSAMLSNAVPFVTSSLSLSSLLTQIAYCSHSFSRHGLEFREFSSVQEIIEERVGRIIIIEWDRAGKVWEKELREGWEGRGIATKKARKGRAPIAEWFVVPEGLATVLSTPIPTPISPWQPSPPVALSLLPPLAHLLNAHATALNSLRLLPAISLYPSLRSSHGKELDRAARVLEAFVDAWSSVTVSSSIEDPSPEEMAALELHEQERLLLVFSAAAFGRWLLPWCEAALRIGVYGILEKEEKNDLVERGKARMEVMLTKLDRGIDHVAEEATDHSSLAVDEEA